MYLLYLDDSGSVPNLNEEYYVLGGACVHEARTYYINRYLDNYARKFNLKNPNEVEFHASDIWSQKKEPWSSIKDRCKRKEIIQKVLGTLDREGKDVCVFSCAVHKKSFPGEDPVELAFEELCNRFDRFLKRIYRQQNQDHKGIIILDESIHEGALQKLATEFRQIGTRWKQSIDNIQEVPLFVDSRASRLIQLADHIAYATFRRYERDDLSYFKIIEPFIDSDEGAIHGLKHKHKIARTCLCPSCMSFGSGHLKF